MDEVARLSDGCASTSRTTVAFHAAGTKPTAITMQRLIVPTILTRYTRPALPNNPEWISQWAQGRRTFSDDAASGRGVSRSFTKKESKNQQQASSGGGDSDQKAKQLKILMAALDAPEDKEPPIAEEERARRYQIGRNFVVGRFQQNNLLDHDMTCKIYMKKHAIRMLPKNTRLREEALKISDEMPPPRRNIPLWTPPIPGFDASKYAHIEGEEE